MKKKSLIWNIILMSILFLYLIITFSSLRIISNIQQYTLLSFIVIGLLSIYGILLDNQHYSLNKVHWYFILVFMFITPLSNLMSGYAPWGFYYERNTVEYANILIIIWECVYLIAYKKSEGSKSTTMFNKTAFAEINIKRSSRIVLEIITLLVTYYMIDKFGFINLLLSRRFYWSGNSFSIVIDYLIRSIPAINFVIFALLKKRGKDISFIEISITLVCTVILNSPIALSRFWVGAVYIGIIICIFPENWLSKRKFDFALLFIILVLFPVFSLFKQHSIYAITNFDLSNFLFSYNNVDFDAYSMLCRLLKYSQNTGFSFGRQIISVILFFVPRSIWNIKGTPTGELVAISSGQSFTNVSMPLMGEGYVDFGIIGVILYALIFAKTLKYFDKVYWLTIHNHNITYFNIIVPFSIGFVLFILRGSLQPTFLRLMGFFLYLMLLYVFKKFILLTVKSRRMSK